MLLSFVPKIRVDAGARDVFFLPPLRPCHRRLSPSLHARSLAVSLACVRHITSSTPSPIPLHASQTLSSGSTSTRHLAPVLRLPAIRRPTSVDSLYLNDTALVAMQPDHPGDGRRNREDNEDDQIILARHGSLLLVMSIPALLYPWHIPFKNSCLTSANKVPHDECGWPPVM